MKTTPIRPVLLGTVMAALLGSAGCAYATFEQGSGACENEVAMRFKEASMADITASKPFDKNHGQARVSWSVMTNRTSASGYCMVNKDGNVTKLKVEHHKKLKKKKSSNGKFDGFYFDSNKKKWHTDDGQVCHSCTPENGFPKNPKNQGKNKKSDEFDGFYFDRYTKKWHTDDGEVCHSCTPENGFPKHP